MRFQTKMVAIYAVFVLALALVLSLGIQRYSIAQNERTEEKNLEVAAEQLVTQMEGIIKPMEATTSYILSDSDVLEAIQMLAYTHKGEMPSSYRDEAMSTVSSGINTDYIVKNFYRTIVFNLDGDVNSTNSSAAKRTNVQPSVKVMPWLLKADATKGKCILVSAHTDPWGYGLNPQVFSVVKNVVGTGLGYIEVSVLVTDLDSLNIANEDIRYLIYFNDSELVYSHGLKKVNNQYEKIAREEGTFTKTYEIDEETQMISKAVSSAYNVTVLTIEDSNVIQKSSAYSSNSAYLVAVIFFIVSMIFVMLVSYYLSKPIRQLRSVMENTKLENMGEEFELQATNDEIEALNISYQNVLERLQKSIVKEKRMSLLQIQAQFDTLQSQVNPHFLYNVLNVIAARGMSNGDEGICEMCGSLAAMLRYSTNTKNRYATIREELEYLEQYFYLLKARYEHKINFEIEVEERIQSQIIPKIVLQQIVENCVNHGFENSTNQMMIKIVGYQKEERWYIEVMDNGQGFDAESLVALNEKILKTKRRLLEEQNNMEMEIGGMGLINTYARLLLIYSDSLTFELKNIKDGAKVVIGADMRKGDLDV
ncbi:MAG: histidine kinase [Lachnospiraceae bacterium]|nr:histidine kinase [Lachnospiraceae bacterium]MDD3614648.1 histidine kinase [Lachnospiraceae bacterium]